MSFLMFQEFDEDEDPLETYLEYVNEKNKSDTSAVADQNAISGHLYTIVLPPPEPIPEPTPIPKRTRPKKTNVIKKKPAKTKAPAKPAAKAQIQRSANTGGVHIDDNDLEEYVTILQLTLEEQLEELNKRKESDNYVKAPFKCDQCYRGFIDTKAWDHHVKKHDPSAGEIECEVCKFRFPTKRALRKHSRSHKKKFACKVCPYVSQNATQAKQHLAWHKGVVYKCEHCNEVSITWTSYLSHVRMKHPSQHICGECGHSFVSQLGLNMHKNKAHKDAVQETTGEGVQESGLYCELCDVKFVSSEAYNRHMVTSVKHSDDFNRGCRLCGATFPGPEELRLHHKEQHAKPKNYGVKSSSLSWPTLCEHCWVDIPNEREYWTHYRREHPDLPCPILKDYVCDICGKDFRNNAVLTYHKQTHSSERLFSCSTCGKSFHNRKNLSTHEGTHSAIRPHACDRCHKAFRTKVDLERHYRIHTGVKPYECEVCGKAFGQASTRKLHVQTVHLKQPTPGNNKRQARRQSKKPSKKSKSKKQLEKEAPPQSDILEEKESVVYDSLPLSEILPPKPQRRLKEPDLW